LEVACDLCGSGEKFNPTFLLAGAFDKQWLANEILLPTDEDLGIDEAETAYPKQFFGDLPVDRLEDYLEHFTVAGLIAYGTTEADGWRIENGKRMTGRMEFPFITIVDAEGILDAWTSRYKGKGIGRQGARTDLTT
jgi:hypothetical protein